MKIGIITHWKDNDNYGAALQSYALQRYLRDIGHDAYVIRYYPRVERHTLSQRFLNVIKKPHLVIDYIKMKFIPDHRDTWDKLRDFSSFRERFISYSPVVYHGLEELRSNPPVADLYITGSDQVWHGSLEITENRTFFLDFGEEQTRRISYAASFGRNYFPCDNEELFKELLHRFYSISMREESGLRILRERGLNCTRCLDSTLLLDGLHYKGLMDKRRHAGKFAFFYTVNVKSPDGIYWNNLRDHFRREGIQSVVTTGSGYIPASEIFVGAKYDYAPVQGWLSNIYYSEIIITASFHGIVFSILFQKDFVYIPIGGKHGAGNDRVTDLLESMGLNDRIANSWENLRDILDKNINYSNLNNVGFDKLLQQSKCFLINSIENE